MLGKCPVFMLRVRRSGGSPSVNNDKLEEKTSDIFEYIDVDR